MSSLFRSFHVSVAAAVEVRIVGFREAGAVRAHVLAGAELHRGLAVALDVPREAEARRDVVPVRQVLRARSKCADRHEAAGAERRAPSIELLKCSKRTPGLIVKRPTVHESCA